MCLILVSQVAGGSADTGHDATLPLYDDTGAMVLESIELDPTTKAKPSTTSHLNVRPPTPHALRDVNTQAYARARGETPQPAPPRPPRLHISDSSSCLVGIP